MGCCQSRVEREETVSLCKARRGYMKHVVKGRHDFATAHLLYLQSLRSTGAALLQFANAETHLPHHLPLLLPSPPPTPPPPPRFKALNSPPTPLSPTATAVRRPPSLTGWDLRDPNVASSRSLTVDDEEEAAADVAVAASNETAAPSLIGVLSQVSKDPTSDIAVIVSRKRKDLAEIVRELEEFFYKAADAGDLVSMLLEPQSCGVCSVRGPKGRGCRYGRSLRPLLRYMRPNPKAIQFGRSKRPGEETTVGRDVGPGGIMSHSATVEKLYAWEKKLYLEVKNEERLRVEREKRVSQVRKQEAKGVDNVKVEKNRKEIERVESRMVVASQAMETISAEIMRLEESELFPQLLELLNGLTSMWRSMYEYHHVQTHITQQLEYLTSTTAAAPTATATTTSASDLTTSSPHQHSTLQLELAVRRWHSSFCALVRSQRDYVHSLAGWLRLSLFQIHPLPRTPLDSVIHALCEEWQLTLDKLPDKAASDGIKSLQAAIHAVVLQQEEEDRQRRRWESALKVQERKTEELKNLERGPPASAMRAKVEALRAKAEEEKAKYERSAAITREMTLSSLQTGLPNVFKALMAFSGVCLEAFEEVYNHHRGGLDRARSLKLLPP